MAANFKTGNKNRFSRLSTWYFLALGVIASIAIVGQVLIQRHLRSQVTDSHVVNLAGAQRYKSQGIVKMSLLLTGDQTAGKDQDLIKTLEETLAEWKRVHEALQHGDKNLNLPGNNSDAVSEMFAGLEPYFNRVYSGARQVIEFKRNGQPNTPGIQAALRVILDNEASFLDRMDKIVFQYDQEARQKIAILGKLEYILLAISLITITLEIIFVFRPTTTQVNQAIAELISSEKNARKLSKEIGALYASLEKTYEDLSIVNQPVENPRLFAKADRGGNVIFIGEALAGLTPVTEANGIRLPELFPGMPEPDDWMDDIVDTVSEGNTWQGDIHFGRGENKKQWVQVVVTPVFNEKDEIEEMVMMGADITKRKDAERNMGVKNRAEIEKKINQQKFRSVLILEGQEEERKRIAMDIHDGIGQMLTSLKFQIESIYLRDSEKAAGTIREIEQLIREVIREVRRVTFNLKPTVLGDYGLQAALNVFVQEIDKLTDIRLVYASSVNIERLPQKTENNIFRIIQEAINNAIKYSESESIRVSLEQSEKDLIISVRDEGKGFDTVGVEARNVNIESGRGFFNMYERTEYINGKLTIESKPGQGTTVTLIVPVHTTVPA